MTLFHVKWSVTKVISGGGKHDDGVRDGDREVEASGEVDREGSSAAAIEADLTSALENAFPRHALGPTYDIDRIYNIEITPTAPAAN